MQLFVKIFDGPIDGSSLLNILIQMKEFNYFSRISFVDNILGTILSLI